MNPQFKTYIKTKLGTNPTYSDGWMPLVCSKILENATKLRLQIHVFGNHLSNMKKLILFTLFRVNWIPITNK
jgi:hypothetical protein